MSIVTSIVRLWCSFQKTESVVKATAEKTTSIFGGLGSGITMKLGQMRNSESFRSLEERVGSAYENVKVNLNRAKYLIKSTRYKRKKY